MNSECSIQRSDRELCSCQGKTILNLFYQVRKGSRVACVKIDQMNNIVNVIGPVLINDLQTSPPLKKSRFKFFGPNSWLFPLARKYPCNPATATVGAAPLSTLGAAEACCYYDSQNGRFSYPSKTNFLLSYHFHILYTYTSRGTEEDDNNKLRKDVVIRTPKF